VVTTRTQTVNRLHVLLTQLLPGGARAGSVPTPQPRCCAPCEPAASGRAPCVGGPSTGGGPDCSVRTGRSTWRSVPATGRCLPS
jgi:hypothetical protein